MPDEFKDAVEKKVLAIGKEHSGAEPSVLNTILAYEKFSPKPYPDFKQTSIGYGTKAVEGEKEIDEPTARKRAIEEINKNRKIILGFAKEKGYNWTPSQINALISFRYNIGNIGELTAGGTRSDAEIAKMMPLYYNVTVDGVKKKNAGLVKRRNKETALFKRGMEEKSGVDIVRGE